MKKTGILIPTGIFLAFVFFTVGFFCARTHMGSAVVISRPDFSETAAETTASDPSVPESAPTDPGAAFPLDLNTVSAEALDTLPGIGPVLAQRIIEYRTAHHGFGSIEELTEVEGIGEKRLHQLLPYLTIGGKKE